MIELVGYDSHSGAYGSRKRALLIGIDFSLITDPRRARRHRSHREMDEERIWR